MKGFRVIRTERILQALQELSVGDLERDTIRGFPGTTKRQFATQPVRIVEMRLTPYEPSGKLLAEATANNEGRLYNPQILFAEVVYEQEDTPQNITFTGSDNEPHHIQQIQFANNNAQVRCNCLDFHYRFAQYDARNDALYGNPPPPYQRRTDTRPPANPLGVPGICKHVLVLIDELQNVKILSR